MKILLIHQAFQSLQGAGGTRHYEFARLCVQQGHEFVAVASDVSYLDASKMDRASSVEVIDGIKIIRATTPAFIHKGFFWRIIAFFIYMFSSFWAAVRESKVDLVMGTSPSLFQAFSAAWVAILKRRPFLLEVRDLWPDFAIEMGILKSRILIFVARIGEKFLYWRAKHILVNSPAYVDYLIGKGIKPEKITLIPNGVDPQMFAGQTNGQRIRDEFDLNGKYVVTYAGAIGPANDIPTIVRGAERLADNPDIHFLLVGGGKALEEVRSLVIEKQLGNVSITGVRQKSEMADFLSASNACVATLQNIPMFKMTYPNKIFDYMAARKPIVLGIDGVIRKVVEESDCGRFFEPGNDEELAATILWMKNHSDEANQMGERGRVYVSKRFNRHVHSVEFLKLAKSLVNKKSNQ